MHQSHVTQVMSHKPSSGVDPRIEILHRIERRRLLPTVNEMMAAHKNAVVIANMRQKNQPIVVPTPVDRLRIFDTETTRLGAWDRMFVMLNQPIVVPTPVDRLRIFDTETTRLGAWDHMLVMFPVPWQDTNVYPNWSRIITLSSRPYRFEWLLHISIFLCSKSC